MAVFELSCNLSSSLFPFASQMWGRSVIFPQYDMNYNRTVFSSLDPGFEKQVPQIFYMHNVMPTVEGYQAVGFETVISNTTTGTSAPSAFGDFSFESSGFGSTPFPLNVLWDRAYTVQTAAQNNFIFVPAAGYNLIYDAAVGVWSSVSPFPPGTVNNNVQVTTAFVGGETYICYANKGVYIYNETSKTLNEQVLLGLDVTQVVAITSANGYLIAVTKLEVAWSSLTNPLDFVPSLITGAGGGAVQDAKGHIVSVAKISGGIIVYCEFNAVGGTYSGNAQFPYIFLEVAGSGGLTGMETLSWASNTASHILWGTYGIQELTKTTAKSVYPELTDFLAAKLFEDFDETTLLLSSTYLAQQLSVKLSIIQARFLVASYGVEPPAYTHALIYDMLLKRWGKVKINHVDCFEWNAPNLYGTTTYEMLFGIPITSLIGTTYAELDTQQDSFTQPKKNMAFMQADGTIKLLNFDYSESNAEGVLILGKFQFRRRLWIEHQYGVIDTVNPADDFNYYIFPSYDGKTLQSAVATVKNSKLSKGSTRTYQRICAGVNISLLFKGKFNLSSFLVGFAIKGNR